MPATTQDILSLEGVVIRKIPLISTSTYAYRDGGNLKNGQRLEVINGRKWIKEAKVNKLGGLYMVTFKNDQFSTVIFNTKYDGIGPCIESAYKDYLHKKGES